MKRRYLNELIMTEVEDDLNCTLCGRKFKSVADLSKHFKQLHEREHKKKMGSGSPKRLRKYLESDKAERYHEAAGESAGGDKSRKRVQSGLSLKLLLLKLYISLQDVAQMDQAADIALTKKVKNLLIMAMAAHKALALKGILKERGATSPANPQDPEPSIAPPVVFKEYQRVIVIISDDLTVKSTSSMLTMRVNT
ncbi:hypothetical protein CEUSTIGMA_g6277.t1 [Chlamydomonas eustigma]|uniref:C2H2-type domain-containing protein n=1 Tax=Chlamydomonas eustigma TaxID=1157962 RepID=A0A250X7E6_9CHLO|nr:hypothetical protein CEUSTIGMA_g6277.t1 [Chlamydomonas eustigma]|eukprot:GAX78839.1 hypothetical protein CEUSTIGMA_g6277.t1 [Chlamydomonas eustigma]